MRRKSARPRKQWPSKARPKASPELGDQELVLVSAVIENHGFGIKGSKETQMTIATETPVMSRTLTLKAPLSGFLVPIERVPDPVFAQKMVGDGIALDPISQTLVAPCDGEIVMLHPAHHALTLVTAGGIELLMHIGLDTINLKGEGFTARVKNGDKVKAGAPLIDFDADYIAVSYTHLRAHETRHDLV